MKKNSSISKINTQLSKAIDKRGVSTQSGFALVATVSVMVLLFMIAVAMLTLSSVEMRSARSSDDMERAKANARMALMMAIAQLQEVAGHDQRVTATADVLDNAATGRAHWTGVWNTSDYDQSSPEDKTFVTWLVSSPDASVISDVDETGNSAGSDDVTIFEGVTDDDSVVVPKVKVDDGSSKPGYFAYWTEDEGVKADLGWSESDTDDDVRDQAARLASSPGVDYGVFEGPFSGISYPLELGGDNSFLEDLDKAVTIATVPLVAGATTPQTEWLQENRHNITLGSLGVMADMKRGGLKRDLSLAFEMDGAADVSATDFPELFSQQEGEFVEGDDRLAAEHLSGGMRGVKDRFLYRDHSGAGALFSEDIANAYTSPSWASVRGPNWWALRDYANLYKRLNGSAGGYSLEARPHYPNVSAGTIDANYTENLAALGSGEGQRLVSKGIWGFNAWNTELNGQGNYIYRPASSNFAPVLLGASYYFSLKTTGGKLNFVADPTFYIWNPYNCNLTAEHYAVTLGQGVPGVFKFIHAKNGGGTETYGPNKFTDFTAGAWKLKNITYLVSGLSMEPGEVLAFSPPAGDSSLNSSLAQGSAVTESTGLTMDKFPVGTSTVNWEEVTIGSDDTITAVYSLSTNGVKTADDKNNHSYTYRQVSYLPVITSGATDLSSESYGDEVQAISFWDNTTNDLAYEIDIDENGVEFDGSGLSAKSPFGALTYRVAAAGSSSGMESFAQFNPAPTGNNERSFQSRCDPNFTVRALIGECSLNTLPETMGFGFPGDTKNGYWGESYHVGSTHVPMADIPFSPLVSLVQFSNAGLTYKTSEAYQAVGNSWASVMVSPVSPYGEFTDTAITGGATAADASWLLNDVLFDRYYLSGIAPEYSLSGGYSKNGSLNDTLVSFFGDDYTSANAGSAMLPYLPNGKTVEDIIAELDDTAAGKGYQKMGAYAMIQGMFNVNSTSEEAWRAMLSANKDLAVEFANSGSDSKSGVPFPSGVSPVEQSGASEYWSGFSRLDDNDIESLATEIVAQVKLRGPFMSLSDFINHRVGGSTATELHYMGALQAAIEETDINGSVQSGAGGDTPDYTGMFASYFPDTLPANNRKTTTGIAGDISQADLLLPLAPRLNARSDTFRIRAYGEVRSKDGLKIIAKATCEAVLQRVPEYMDAVTDASDNEPWDEALENPLPMTIPGAGTLLNEMNTKFGRKFKLIDFKWLSSAEI